MEPYAGLGQAMHKGQVQATEKNLALLSNAWRLAQEHQRSVQSLEQAAQRAPDGKLYAQLAQLYLMDEQFLQAEKASREALNKGSLDKPGQVYNALAIALFKQNKTKAAQQIFTQAKQYPSAQKMALLWEKQLKQSQAISQYQ